MRARAKASTCVGLTSGCRSVGVELSAGGIRATAARISTVPNARLIQANILAMPLQSGIFDYAYSYGVVHHTIDPEGAVREIVRTLKPGGTSADLCLRRFRTPRSAVETCARVRQRGAPADQRDVARRHPPRLRSSAARVRRLHAAIEIFLMGGGLSISGEPESDDEEPDSGFVRSLRGADRGAVFRSRRARARRAGRL